MRAAGGSLGKEEDRFLLPGVTSSKKIKTSLSAFCTLGLVIQ